MVEVWVTLSESELRQAIAVGVERQIQNVYHSDRQPSSGAGEENSWQWHIQGSCGECVIAKHFGIYWVGVGKFRGPDVGEYEVRCSASHYIEMRMKRDDPEDSIFLFVTGVNGNFCIRGWIYGHEGKKEEYWGVKKRENHPQFWVPQEIFHPLEELPEPPSKFMEVEEVESTPDDFPGIFAVNP